MYFLFEYCSNPDFLTIINFIFKLIDVIFFVVPIILVVTVSISFAKNVMSGSVDDMQKNVHLVIKKFIYAVAIFLIPTIVEFCMTIVSDAGNANSLMYLSCITNATDEKIAELKQQEEQEEQERQEQNNASNNSGSNSGGNNSSSNNGGNNSSSNSGGNNASNDGSSSSSSGSNSNNKKENVDNSGKKTGVDFSKVYSCGNGKVIASSNGIKLRECSSDYQTSFFQNISITDNYIYFSRMSTKKSGNEVINRNKIVRISKNTGKFQTMYIDYAGHAQSFDVANNYSFNSKDLKGDKIFLNYFTRYIADATPPEANSGVTYSTFDGKANTTGAKKIPEIGYAVKIRDNKPYSLTAVKQDKYIKNGKFDLDTYKQVVKQIGNGAGSTYFANLQYAVDETHNQILVFDPRGDYQMGYVYKLDDFLNGKLNLNAEVHIDKGYGQGVEIYGDYIYYVRGYDTIEFRKYNIKTRQQVKYVELNLTNYGVSAGKKLKELEGITVHNGKVYLGFNYSKSGKNYALIVYVDQ